MRLLSTKSFLHNEEVLLCYKLFFCPCCYIFTWILKYIKNIQFHMQIVYNLPIATMFSHRHKIYVRSMFRAFTESPQSWKQWSAKCLRPETLFIVTILWWRLYACWREDCTSTILRSFPSNRRASRQDNFANGMAVARP